MNYQFFFQTIYLYFFFGISFFLFLGLIDDKRDINANLKFLIEIILVSILIFDNNLLIEKIYFQSFDKIIYLGKYSFLFSILSIVIFINALKYV